MASLRKLERRFRRLQRFRIRTSGSDAAVSDALWRAFTAVERERTRRGRPDFWNGQRWTRRSP